MEKPTYSIRELEDYLSEKQAGRFNEQIEKVIQNDPFLQTVFIGLEKRMMEHNNSSTIDFLKAKKQKIWYKMEHRVSTPNNTATNPSNGDFLDTLLGYSFIKNYNPHFLRIHILLGLNCSCVFVLILIACWLNNTADATLLLSHLDGLVGYRP